MGDLVWGLIFALFLLVPSMFGEQFAHVKQAYDKELAKLKEKERKKVRRSKLP